MTEDQAAYIVADPITLEELREEIGNHRRALEVVSKLHTVDQKRFGRLEGRVQASFSEAKFNDLFAGLEAHMIRIESIESKLEVLAAMVETPPPPGDWQELVSEIGNRAHHEDVEMLSRQIEAIELRQNLVESPVMLRIASAVEELANHFCSWDSMAEDRREFESSLP